MSSQPAIEVLHSSCNMGTCGLPMCPLSALEPAALGHWMDAIRQTPTRAHGTTTKCMHTGIYRDDFQQGGSRFGGS